MSGERERESKCERRKNGRRPLRGLRHRTPSLKQIQTDQRSTSTAVLLLHTNFGPCKDADAVPHATLPATRLTFTTNHDQAIPNLFAKNFSRASASSIALVP